MPAPPADLRGRVLPIWEGSGPWMRMHAAGRDPLYFGKAGRNRFDDPLKGYGVLYAADDAAGSFVESFGRSPGRNLVSPEALAARSLARIVADRRLRLVDLTGPGLARIGATGAISTSGYRRAQAWSRALHTHPDAPDGFRYRLRHDPSRSGVALFDRIGPGALRSESLGTLADPALRKLLATILDEYGFGLEEGLSP